MRNFIFGVLAAIVVIGIAAGAYFVGQKTSPKKESVPASTNSTAQEEASIPSPTLIPTTNPTPTITQANDADLIPKALAAKNGWGPDVTSSLTIKVSTNDGKYASGTVGSKSGQGGGGYFYAIKVNGNWEIVADGNGTISCAQVNKYPDYPKILIPQCWDQTTGKLVKR
ncbi:MAG: hypothetical protein Q8P26_00715 [Candidatus Levybacteria bacterium]|nr:hypothetical protein [Candidatus Levybacteria bacterium]